LPVSAVSVSPMYQPCGLSTDWGGIQGVGKKSQPEDAWGVVDALWRYHYSDVGVLGEWTLITGSDAVMHNESFSAAVPMVKAIVDPCHDVWPVKAVSTFQDSRCPPGMGYPGSHRS
jgi:hypothetical protein